MKNIFYIATLLIFANMYSQQKDFNLPKGNKEYAKKEYANAEADYRISKFNNEKRASATYNLGNSIYKQNQSDEAQIAFAKTISIAKDKQQKFAAYHNIGNTYMKDKEYGKAVESYKNALRNNPKDNETRYNYALAKKMQKDNPEKKDDKKDKNKDKDKDKKDKPKEGNDKKDNQGKPKEDKQKPQPQQGGASQEKMKNLLDAVNNEEKKVQEKVNGKKVKGSPTENQKDW
jgi:tetratricopeptide (TPR) repeat protein